MPLKQPLLGTRVLIAEDNAIQAYDLKRSLEDAGAEVVGPARTVAEVLALARPPALTCAVLDVILGRNPVFPAAKALQERGINIIFHTGSNDVQALIRGWPEAHIVTKPASSELLMQAVCEACKPPQ